MTDEQADRTILDVLDGQSVGYACLPNASAFIAAGLELVDTRVTPNPFDQETVRASLDRLTDGGLAAGEDDGWVITDPGRSTLAT